MKKFTWFIAPIFLLCFAGSIQNLQTQVIKMRAAAAAPSYFFEENFEGNPSTPYNFDGEDLSSSSTSAIYSVGDNKSGSYSLTQACADAVAIDYSRVYLNDFGSSDYYWYLGEFWLDSGFSGTGIAEFYLRGNESDTAFYVMVGNGAGGYYWQIANNNGGDVYSDQGTIVADTKYFIKFQWVKGTGANSISRLWVKTSGTWGDPLLEITNGTSTTAISYIKLGPHMTSNNGAWTTQTDNIHMSIAAADPDPDP